MSEISEEMDYGPLKHLNGLWKGDKGIDVAPDLDGKDIEPFYETIRFEQLAPILSNAKKQWIAPIFYHQRVIKKSTNIEFHNQCGYWMWVAEDNLIMHTLTIPRGMGLVAGGYYNGETDKDGNIIIALESGLDHPDWPVAQSPFLRDNASTSKFTYTGTLSEHTMKYCEITLLDIYGDKEFRHVDNSTLTKES